MKKNSIIYGCIAGLVVSALMLINILFLVNTGGKADFDKSVWIGYASMLIAFSMVFVGIKNYRDKYLGGEISFGKAFKTGTVIVLIAATIYALTWLVEYYYLVPDFMDRYAAYELDKLKASGASEIEMGKQEAEMASFAKMYQNPYFNLLMSYAEILPVGLLVALVSSLILKTKAKKI